MFDAILQPIPAAYLPTLRALDSPCIHNIGEHALVDTSKDEIRKYHDHCTSIRYLVAAGAAHNGHIDRPPFLPSFDTQD